MYRSSNGFSDLGLWMLLAFNLYTIYYCFNFPNEIHTVYVIFWMQSVSIGFFNVLGMLYFNKRDILAFNADNSDKDNRGCAALFFTFHYGTFHFVYLIFLLAKLVDFKQLDFTFIKLSFWIIIATGVLQFIQDFNKSKTQPVNANTLFALPYLRVVPMHLAILAPNFFNISATLLFLILKTLADVFMHIIYKKFVFKKQSI